MTHVVKSKVVKVSIGAAGGHRIAQILTRGAVLPEGVSPESVAHLESLGFIEKIAIEPVVVEPTPARAKPTTAK